MQFSIRLCSFPLDMSTVLPSCYSVAAGGSVQLAMPSLVFHAIISKPQRQPWHTTTHPKEGAAGVNKQNPHLLAAISEVTMLEIRSVKCPAPHQDKGVTITALELGNSPLEGRRNSYHGALPTQLSGRANRTV